MPGSTAIECTDASWNPVTGCTQVSAGCDHCYAKTFAERFRGVPGHPYEQGFDLRLWPDRLVLPLQWRKPRRIFVNSMSDLFHAGVPEAFIERVFATMAACPQHTFQVLTKRPRRMQAVVASPEFAAGVHHARAQIKSPGVPPGCFPPPWPGWPLPNVWLGVSVESQEVAWRIDWLVRTPAVVRFLSCEPLIAPLNLTRWMPPGFARWQCSGCDHFFADPLLHTCPECGRLESWSGSHRGNGRPNGQPLGWVIAGGESGPGHRPIAPEWVRRLRDDCHSAGVPFFFKQFGGRTPKAGGRLLDGREWNQFPDGHGGIIEESRDERADFAVR